VYFVYPRYTLYLPFLYHFQACHPGVDAETIVHRGDNKEYLWTGPYLQQFEKLMKDDKGVSLCLHEMAESYRFTVRRKKCKRYSYAFACNISRFNLLKTSCRLKTHQRLQLSPLVTAMKINSSPHCFQAFVCHQPFQKWQINAMTFQFPFNITEYVSKYKECP